MTSQDESHWSEVEDAVELLGEGDAAGAVVALAAVVKDDPRNTYAFHYLGLALQEVGRTLEACDAQRASLRLAPDYLGARISLSHGLRRLGDAAGAVDEANEALRRFPGDGDALFAAGLAHAALGQHVLARRRLEAFLATGPAFELQAQAQALLESLTAARAERRRPHA